jgi:hypothetical protein
MYFLRGRFPIQEFGLFYFGRIPVLLDLGSVILPSVATVGKPEIIPKEVGRGCRKAKRVGI